MTLFSGYLVLQFSAVGEGLYSRAKRLTSLTSEQSAEAQGDPMWTSYAHSCACDSGPQAAGEEGRGNLQSMAGATTRKRAADCSRGRC